MPANHITHGMSKTRLYRIYRDMVNRCNGKKKRDYDNYYARGITYCKEWDTFEGFRDWALSNDYRDDLTIDRIDVNGNYEPNNCRWATKIEQNNNTRQNHFITYNGETHTMKQWANILGINYATLKSRLLLYGWTVEEAFTTRLLRGGETRCNI